MPMTSSPVVSSGPSGLELALLADKPIVEKKAAAYAEVVKNLNSARQHGLPFKVRQRAIPYTKFFKLLV